MFGLAPALHAVRGNVTDALADGGRGGTTGRARQRFRRVLVIGQIALALVLVTGSGLLVQSFLRLRQVDPGSIPSTSSRPVSISRRCGIRRTGRSGRSTTISFAVSPRCPVWNRPAAARALPMTGRLDIGDWSFVMEGRYSVPIKPEERRHADWQAVTPELFPHDAHSGAAGQGLRGS